MSRASLALILTDKPPPAIKKLHAESAALFGVGGRRKKAPHDMESHLKAINAILKQHYAVTLVANNKKADNTTTFGFSHTPWPDNILSKWAPNQAERPLALDAVYEGIEQ